MSERLNTTGNQNKEELKGTPLLWNIKNIVFENPIEDVLASKGEAFDL